MAQQITTEELRRLFPKGVSDAVLKRNQSTYSPITPAPVKIEPITDVAKLNKTETAYHAYLKCLGDVWIGVQCITLKLANDCRLTCDFFALDKEGNLRAIDTKGGFWREDAKIKINVAARMYPWITFIVAHKEKNGWRHEIIKP